MEHLQKIYVPYAQARFLLIVIFLLGLFFFCFHWCKVIVDCFQPLSEFNAMRHYNLLNLYFYINY